MRPYGVSDWFESVCQRRISCSIVAAEVISSGLIIARPRRGSIRIRNASTLSSPSSPASPELTKARARNSSSLCNNLRTCGSTLKSSTAPTSHARVSLSTSIPSVEARSAERALAAFSAGVRERNRSSISRMRSTIPELLRITLTISGPDALSAMSSSVLSPSTSSLRNSSMSRSGSTPDFSSAKASSSVVVALSSSSVEEVSRPRENTNSRRRSSSNEPSRRRSVASVAVNPISAVSASNPTHGTTVTTCRPRSWACSSANFTASFQESSIRMVIWSAFVKIPITFDCGA